MDLAKKLLVPANRRIDLAKIDPAATPGLDKKTAAELLESSRERLGELGYKLYAENRRSLLVILQGMDAAGKDGTIRKVMTGLNPQGCRVVPFKQPTSLELRHDFLWRIHQAVPAHGEIGVFNRSHYEDVLIARVHKLVQPAVWKARYEQINQFEQQLAASGTVIVKFFLYISRDEQRQRLQDRLANPTKNWKLSVADLEECKLWDDYVGAYEDVLSRCSTREAPWFVIPANHKWYRNAAVASILVETLERLKLRFPKGDPQLIGRTIE